MIGAKQDIIRTELEAGTGAGIGMAIDQSGTRTALLIWFSDLDAKRGPVAELKPYGLRGYRVILSFGRFAGEFVRQIGSASAEDVDLARALVASIGPSVDLDLSGQRREDWLITSGSFTISAVARALPSNTDDAVSIVCREVIVPLMAAMAELIGYDEITGDSDEEGELEGGILTSTITRRERNPRNRLLCLRLRGDSCTCCGLNPRMIYGDAGAIIEVHHLEPLSLLDQPRRYDPSRDLVPLCPNCHRAVHTRRPVPYTIDDLRERMNPHTLSVAAT